MNGVSVTMNIAVIFHMY